MTDHDYVTRLDDPWPTAAMADPDPLPAIDLLEELVDNGGTPSHLPEAQASQVHKIRV